MGTLDARQRFRRWLEERDAAGVPRSTTAKDCACSETLLRLILRVPPDPAARLPGRRIANAIERATASWTLGPLTSEEWDRLERDEEAAAKAAARADADEAESAA